MVFDLPRFESEPVLGIVRGLNESCLEGVLDAAFAGGLRFLEITLGGIFREGKTCYMAKNGKCRQDGRHGSKVSLPCKTSGKQT